MGVTGTEPPEFPLASCQSTLQTSQKSFSPPAHQQHPRVQTGNPLAPAKSQLQIKGPQPPPAPASTKMHLKVQMDCPRSPKPKARLAMSLLSATSDAAHGVTEQGGSRENQGVLNQVALLRDF